MGFRPDDRRFRPGGHPRQRGRREEFGLEGGGPTLIHVETMRGCGHAHYHDDLYLEPHPARRKATSTRRCWTIGKPKTLSRRTVRCCLNSASMKTTCTPWRLRKPGPLSRPSRRSMPCLGLSLRPLRKAQTSLHGAETHASHLHRLNGADLMQASSSPLDTGKLAWSC